MFAKEIAPALEDEGIRFVDWDDLAGGDRAYLETMFAEHIFPVLTPLAVDPAHPFPYISNLSLNLAVTVRDGSSGEARFARVKVPPLLPRFIVLPDAERFIPLEQVIAAKLDALFPGMEILDHQVFRVTRDADFDLEDEAEDLLEAIESVLRRRNKFGRVVRLEVDTKMSREVLEVLCRELELSERDVTVIDGAARPRRAVGALRGRPPGAQGRRVGPADPGRARWPRGREPTSSASCRPVTCSCTTRTTRSRRRSRSSSSRPPTTRTCSRSSRRSTAPRARRARSCARW